LAQCDAHACARDDSSALHRPFIETAFAPSVDAIAAEAHDEVTFYRV
jgi:hypothetical protein